MGMGPYHFFYTLLGNEIHTEPFAALAEVSIYVSPGSYKLVSLSLVCVCVCVCVKCVLVFERLQIVALYSFLSPAVSRQSVHQYE